MIFPKKLSCQGDFELKKWVVSKMRHPTLWQDFLFGCLSASMVCLTFWFGKQLWPPGLPAWAQHVFWPASAVNLAGMLLLGWRRFPWIWLSVPAVVLVFQEPILFSILGATGNVVEALIGCYVVRKIGRFTRGFDRTRSVLSLMVVSLLAPIPATSLVPVWLFMERGMDFHQFWMAIWNWNFSNGAAILLATPFLYMLSHWPASLLRRRKELILLMGTVMSLTVLTFGAVLLGRGDNFAFLLFPILIWVAVQLGPNGVAVGGVTMMVSIYITLSFYASRMEISEAASHIWFIQAFCWVLGATGLLIAALVEERHVAQRKFANARSRALSISLREERARLDALRYQINPHFLFNALNSLRATFPSSAETTRDMVTDLSEYLRATLARPRGDFICIKDELEMVQQYLSIEKKRFPEDLLVEVDIAEELQDQRMPVFIIQPLVENAIVHGLAKSQEQMRLCIKGYIESEQVIIEVANTGKWQPVDPSRPHLGNHNIRHRLRLIYGSRASFEIKAQDEWVRAIIKIPKESCVA